MGNNVGLHPLGIQYYDLCIEYALDKDLVKYVSNLKNASEKKIYDFLEKAQNEWKREKPSFLEFAIINEDGVFVGTTSVYFDYDKKECEIGGVIRRKYLHNGYSYCAASLLIESIFSKYDVDRIIAKTDEHNYKAIGLLYKLGMNFWKKDENILTMNIYCIDKNKYKKST